MSRSRHCADSRRRTDGQQLRPDRSGRGYRFLAPVTRVEPSTPRSGTSGGGTIAEATTARSKRRCCGSDPRRAAMGSWCFHSADLSDDREQQSVADGLTDDLTIDRRASPACSSSRAYHVHLSERPVDTNQIGRDLGVR